MKYSELIGTKIGLFTIKDVVLMHDGNKSNPRANRRKLMCVCDCGNTRFIKRSDILRYDNPSCGCVTTRKQLSNPNYVPDKKNMPEFESWRGMIERCTNKNSISYPNYGGKGIKVCEAWMDFYVFFKDLGERPKGSTLDRKDVYGDYCKDNCRWATQAEQSRNKSNNVNLLIDGKTMCVADWCQEYNINRTTVLCRLKRGWPASKAIKTPARQTNTFR